MDVRGDTKQVPPNLSEELYLILREATRNALSHAHATEIRVSIDISERCVIAAVTDNGRGFISATRSAPHGGGLPSMAERVELLCGSFDLTSTPGRGTSVCLRLPLGGTHL